MLVVVFFYNGFCIQLSSKSSKLQTFAWSIVSMLLVQNCMLLPIIAISNMKLNLRLFCNILRGVSWAFRPCIKSNNVSDAAGLRNAKCISLQGTMQIPKMLFETQSNNSTNFLLHAWVFSQTLVAYKHHLQLVCFNKHGTSFPKINQTTQQQS